MKIKITQAPPVDAKHGVTMGREYDVLEEGTSEGRGHRDPVWIMGDAQERVRVFAHEYQIVRRPVIK